MDDSDHKITIKWLKQTNKEWTNIGASGVEMMTMLAGIIL